MSSSLPSTQAAIITPDGLVSAEWYRFFAQFHFDSTTSESIPGTGLATSGGVLGIAANGVTNAMLRQSLSLSIMGRPLGSTGNPQDIQAGADGQFLQRDAGIVSFRYPKSPSFTVATLPAANLQGAGTRLFATDATVTTFASIVAGGGANGVPVYSDGTNWRIG